MEETILPNPRGPKTPQKEALLTISKIKNGLISEQPVSLRRFTHFFQKSDMGGDSRTNFLYSMY